MRTNDSTIVITARTENAPETIAVKDLLVRMEYAELALADTWNIVRARRLAKLIDRYATRAATIVEPLKVPHSAFPLTWALPGKAHGAARQVRVLARSIGVDVTEFPESWSYPLI